MTDLRERLAYKLRHHGHADWRHTNDSYIVADALLPMVQDQIRAALLAEVAFCRKHSDTTRTTEYISGYADALDWAADCIEYRAIRSTSTETEHPFLPWPYDPARCCIVAGPDPVTDRCGKGPHQHAASVLAAT